MSTAEDGSKPRYSATTHPQRQLATGLGIGAGRVTRAGLAAAAANGRKGGRPRKVDDAAATKARNLRDKGINASDIAKMLGISRATMYRYLSDGVPVPM
jgi:transposase